MVRAVGGAQASAVGQARGLGHAPPISDEQFEAAIGRSRHARNVRDRLETAVGSGLTLSRSELEELVENNRRSDGSLDPAVAVVLAKYQQEHPEILSAEANALLNRVFDQVDWIAVCAEVANWVEQQKEIKAAETRKKEQLQDDIRYDERKVERQREHRARANQARANRLDAELRQAARLHRRLD